MSFRLSNQTIEPAGNDTRLAEAYRIACSKLNAGQSFDLSDNNETRRLIARAIRKLSQDSRLTTELLACRALGQVWL